MPSFDPNAYFVNRLQNTGANKVESLAQASREKVAALQQYQDDKSRIAITEAGPNDKPWVTQLGLNPNSAAGEAVNLAASFGSGATRVAGQLASLPANVMALMDEAHLNDADVAAYTRYKQNAATPEDIALLSQVKSKKNGTDIPKEGAPTTLQLFERANELRKTGLGITELADTSKIVHQGKRDKLNQALGANFDSAWEQTKQGASDLWNGEVLTGGGNLAHGVARLIYNAGEAAVTNPAASAEYITENIPQLIGGLAGKTGKVALTASNVGYGTDLYQQGIKRYQEANDGALPSVEQRQQMAMHAAGAVLAEQASDLVQLSAIKTAGKVAKEGTEAVTRTGFKQSLKNSLKAGGEGVLSEAPTEGYQTYAEGQATLKPASPLEIYQGASIGGIAGAGLSGGGRAVAEAVGATPEKAAKRAEDQAKDEAFLNNVKTNNTAEYLDENSKSYNPVEAVRVHFANSVATDATPEAKQQNVEKVHDIISGLETKRELVQAELNKLTPEGLKQAIADRQASLSELPPERAAKVQQLIDMMQKDLNTFDPKAVDQKHVKSLKTQLTTLDRQIAESSKLRDQLQIETKPQEADVAAAVDSADTKVDMSSEESVAASKNAVAHVVSLAMSHPDSFSDDHLNRLVSNQNNGLSTEQRSFLRSVSESRIAENAMKNLGIVENEVMKGDPSKNQLGIADYKQRMQSAITSRNEEKAATALHMLGKFADAHQQKLDTFVGLFNQVGKKAKAFNVVPTKQGWQLAPTQDLSLEGMQANRRLGGMTISAKSSKLIKQVRAESAALHAARNQLQSAYALRFSPQQQQAVVPPVAPTTVNQSGSTEAVNSVNPSTARAAPEQNAVDSVDKAKTSSNQSTVDSTVDTQVASTKPSEFGDALSALEAEEESTLNELEQASGHSDRATQEGATQVSQSQAKEDSGNRETDGKSQSREEAVGEESSPTENSETRESGKLSVFREVVDLAGKKFGEAFKQINLIAHNLQQKASKGGKTQRPLVAVKDFLSQWSQGSLDEKAIESFIGEAPTDAQKALLNHFQTLANKWLPSITKNLVQGRVAAGVKYKKAVAAAHKIEDPKEKAAELARIEKEMAGIKPGKINFDPDMKYKNPIQYLIELDESGKADMEENIKTAIAVAAFMYVAENAKAPQLSSPDSIKAMFGVNDYETLPDSFSDYIATLGTPERATIISMGQRATQALGLSAKKGATQDFLARLEADLGAYVMKLLVDVQVLERTVVPPQLISSGLGHLENHDASKQGSMAFLRMKRTKGKTARQRELLPVADGISTLAKGTQGIMSKLFGVEAQVKEPSLEPIKFTQSNTANTDQAIPDELKRVIQHENSVANYLRQDVWTLLQGLGEEAFLKMAGYTDIDESTMHKSSILSAEVSNEALQRELNAAMDYFETLGKDQAFYLPHSVWKQQRVGIDSVINPQSSKIHRWMISRADWKTTVTSTDAAMMDNFMLRVAEGLGVKTDKQSNENSLAVAHEIFNTESEDEKTKDKAIVLQKAIDALIRTRQPGAEMSAADTKAILAGVKAGGEKMHSMDALIAMANYQEAKAGSNGNPFSFDVQMMGEVDGVTNGPMLSHLALGAASSVESLMARLNKGGFFQEGSGFQNYNVWRGQQGHADLYETTISAVIHHLSGQAGKAATFDRLQKITGVLFNQEKNAVEKAGRNIIKTPLTAMLFGSTVKGAVASMFRDFIAKSYEGLEKIAKLDVAEQQAELDAYIDNLNALLYEADVVTQPIEKNTLAEFLANFEFSESQEKALEEVFNKNLGESVKATMESEFSAFLAIRNTINQTANATFGMFNAAYQGIRQNVINELITSGDIAVGNAKTPNALHDLTPEQEALIDARIAKLNPVVQTFMAKQSANSAESGLHISKSSRKLSQEGAYKNVSQFGQPFPEDVDGNPGALSLTNVAYQRILDNPGVAMVPMLIHSLDSAISHMALMGRQVLNVHDAHGSGLKGFIETAQALNKSTWNALLHFSPAAEMRDSFKNTLLGMDALLQSGEKSDAVIQNMQKFLSELSDKHGSWAYGEKHPMPLRQVLAFVASEMYTTAYNSDKTKYQAMAQLAHVDQYALEGGQYDVTEADRAEAAKLLKDLGKEARIPRGVWNAIDRINEVVLGVQTETGTSPYGELGKSSIKSDIDLVQFFEAQPLQNSGDVAKLIMGKLSPANQVMLRKAMKLVGPEFKIQMLTSRTQDGAMGKQFNARGWFAYNGEKEAIYVLSPEFKASGLTPELIVHELLHAALAKTINHPNTKEAKELVKSLESLVGTVQAHLDANPELKAKYGFKLDVHELVSWGMSDLGFQQDVLANVPVYDHVTGKLTRALKRFVQLISGFLGLPLTVRIADGSRVDNALGILIQDVSALFAEAKNSSDKATDSHSSAMEHIERMSTVDVYEALDEQTTSPSFDEHLRGLLSGIVEKLHGPYGTFKAMVESKQAKTPKELWDQAKGKGTAPFGSKVLAAGVSINDQAAFVLEQVEATIQGALDANTGAAHDVVVELDRLYKEVRSKLENSTTLSPALKDLMFKIDSGSGNRSRHLAQFAALGLAHPEVNAALKMNTERVQIDTKGSFAHRLETIFQKALEWFNGRLTHTFAGQQADQKLSALVRQLVEIEAKRKEPMLQKASALDFVEDSLKQGSAKLKSKVEAFGRSKWIKDRKSSIVRASGAVLSTVAGERTEAVLNHIQSIRDRQINQGFGLTMGLVNEIRGMNDGNKMFHRLIREAKLREGIREDLIVHTGNVALESFANQGKDLTQNDKHALTAGLLRTDIAALLDHHSMADITNLLSSTTALQQEISRLEGQLAPYTKARGFYERYAKNLAYKMATGNVKGQHLLMNARNIAHLFGTGYEHYVTAAEAAAATPILDQLTSLYAFKYTEQSHKDTLARILSTEASRGNSNGAEMILKLHKSLQDQSKERLFDGSEALMMKGYTPEIYDPKKEVLVATEREGTSLEAQGFTKGKQVAYDPNDPDRGTPRFVYKRDGGGLRPWLSAIFSYTGETAKGSRSKTDNVKNLTEWKANQEDLQKMHRDKQTTMQREFRYDPTYDPSKIEENFAAPVLNPEGQVTDYRYLMREENKDDLLNRDSRFEKVLGFFAGNIYDKESTKESNRKAVQALYDQYKADFATRSESYRKVGMDSEDNELRDIYRMLPEDTKQAIRDIWGSEHMMVRSDLMDINFGYRKTSVTDAFHKEHKNVVDRLFTGLMTHMMGEKAEYNLRRAEDIWQEIVAETKEILVIKNLSTLIGNIGSNISLLYWQGVPLKDMARYHRIALKGVNSYRKDSADLIELETQLAAGYITTTRAEMEREISRLKDALERNPVKELIDAGLMPSIVEDVSPEDDMYSYKSRLVNYVGDNTKWVNKHIAGAARTVYMAKDTKMYQALHHATQLSDFVARYALYAHVTSRKQNPMSKDEAIQLASDSFVNYDLPSHRKLQYMNDMGFVMFTKYYLRIQKVIAHLYAENPGRAAALLVTNHFFSNAPVLTDSGFTHKLGNNPFGLGAFAYPGVLDELATIKMFK